MVVLCHVRGGVRRVAQLLLCTGHGLACLSKSLNYTIIDVRYRETFYKVQNRNVITNTVS